MTNVPRQVQSFPESLYRKRDGWVVIILWLVIIISLASASYISPEDKTSFLQELAAKAFDCADWVYALMGIVNEEVFLMTLRARSEEALDAFLPTQDQMVASIAPTE